MSQIIPLGIGSPAEIPELVLTGLSPAALPPPPAPGTSGEFRSISPGETVASFSEFSAVIFTDGIEFTLPPYPVEVTWQVIYDSAPALTDIVIQVSVDGSNWITVSESTNINGEIKTFTTSARFIRAGMLDITEGTLVTVLLNITRIDYGWF